MLLVKRFILPTISIILIWPFFAHAEINTLWDFTNAVMSDVTVRDNPYDVFKAMCINLQALSAQDTHIIYDPRQSLFVTMFCNSLPDLLDGQKEKELFYNPDISVWLYLKRSTLRDLGRVCIPWQTNDRCIPASRQSNNDYHYAMTKLMLEIQNEWSNIALARLYGINNINDKDNPTTLSNNIIALKYNAIAKQTVRKDYPKTVKKMEAYINRARNKLLSKLQIIDLKKIKESESSLDDNGLCLIYGIFFQQIDQKISTNCIASKEDNTRSYTHLLYNELFFYTLFSSTYEQYLDQFQFAKASTPANKKIPWLSDLVSQDILTIVRSNISNQRNSIITTTNQTSKALRDFEWSFDLHIGMLMYQEDLLDLRWSLAKVYTPLHQLHYKLENVQKAKTT